MNNLLLFNFFKKIQRHQHGVPCTLAKPLLPQGQNTVRDSTPFPFTLPSRELIPRDHSHPSVRAGPSRQRHGRERWPAGRGPRPPQAGNVGETTTGGEGLLDVYGRQHSQRKHPDRAALPVRLRRGERAPRGLPLFRWVSCSLRPWMVDPSCIPPCARSAPYQTGRQPFRLAMCPLLQLCWY